MDQAMPRKKHPAKKHGWLRKITLDHCMKGGVDIPFLILVLILVFIGLVMLASASYAYALNNEGNSYHFISRQAIWAMVGLCGMGIASCVDYKIFHKISIPLWLGCLVLLVWALAVPTKDAHRWIYFGGFQFQPSEVAKLALILLLSHVMSIFYKEKYHGRWDGLGLFAVCMFILGVTAILIIREPHLSCTVIICLISGYLMIAGGIRARWILILVAIIAIGLLAVLFSGMISYSSARLDVWRDPFGYADKNLSHQTRQSLYAIASGGLFGRGLGNSRQKYLYLPEPQNDFIFAIVCEEFGFIGAVLVMALFGLLVWRGVVIALRARDKFGMLVAMGLTVQVGIQALLNFAVVTNSIPNTGISLPFFSYGGTSLMLLLGQMGIVLSVSRTARVEKVDRKKKRKDPPEEGKQPAQRTL